MRLALAVALLTSTAMCGQTLLEPSKVPTAEKYFGSFEKDTSLHCQVQPIPPRLNFSFLLQAGYVISVPMKQYFGSNHALAILSRVTPEGGGPAYFATGIKLPDIPKTKNEMEVAGVYLVGEGRYKVDLVLFDEANRVCRKSWRFEAKLSTAERSLKLGLPPESVSELSFRHWSPGGKSLDDVRPIRRLTVFLHAAPLFSRSIRFRARDRGILLSSLATLLETLPARSVRLVIFNLDQQKELFRQDVLTPQAFEQAAGSMDNLQLQLVDYRVLQNRGGHISLLTELVNKELRAQERSDAVIFLGPTARYFDKVPEFDLSANAPHFFYLQYKPFYGRGADFPDSIEFAIKKVRGKAMLIHTPDEFAKAIKQIESEMTAVMR
jgi:hypothetical protein